MVDAPPGGATWGNGAPAAGPPGLGRSPISANRGVRRSPAGTRAGGGVPSESGAVPVRGQIGDGDGDGDGDRDVRALRMPPLATKVGSRIMRPHMPSDTRPA